MFPGIDFERFEFFCAPVGVPVCPDFINMKGANNSQYQMQGSRTLTPIDLLWELC